MSTLSTSALLGACVLSLGLLAFATNDPSAPAAAAAVVVDEAQQPAAAADPNVGTAREQEPAASDDEPQQPTLTDHNRAAERAIRQAMQKKIDTTLMDVPLRDFVDYVGEQGGFPVQLHKTAINEEGIADDEPLNDTLNGVTIEHALNWVLQRLGMTWVIEDGMLKITTEIDAEEKLFTRTYDVSTLLALSDAESGGCADSSPFGLGADGCLEPGPFESKAGWLTELLRQETSGPWISIDGTGGTITGMRDTITVRQTWKMHEEVGSLLTALNAAAKSEAKESFLPARPKTYSLAADRKIEEALTKKLSIDYLDVPLDQVAADLADKTKIRLRIKSNQLEEEAIRFDHPIRLTLNNLPLGSILHTMFEPLGMTYYVSEGALWITTEIDAEEMLSTTVYDVRDLVGPDKDYDSLIEVLQQETSGPWMEIDGTGGTLSEAEPVKALAIRQTYKVHQEIRQILADLRATVAKRPAVEQPQEDPAAVVLRVYNLANLNIVDDMLTAVPKFVAPDKWGGENSGVEIQKVAEALVIRQTKSMHEEIEKFLQKFGYFQSQPIGMGTGMF